MESNLENIDAMEINVIKLGYKSIINPIIRD